MSEDNAFYNPDAVAYVPRRCNKAAYRFSFINGFRRCEACYEAAHLNDQRLMVIGNFGAPVGRCDNRNC